MQPTYLSETAQGLYSQLLDIALHSSPAVTGIQFVRAPGGGKRLYWYLEYRVGEHIKRHYLGPDTKELRAKVDAQRDSMAGRKTDAAQRKQLVAAARAAGAWAPLATEGRVLEAMEQAGLFCAGAVIVGSYAFNTISNMLGVKWPLQWTRTTDIDVGAHVKISVPRDISLDQILDATGVQFLPVQPFKPTDPVTQYRIRGREISVQLLTPMYGRPRDRPVTIRGLGSGAEALRFLDYVMEAYQQAVIPVREGVLVNVPHPGRFALHKLVVSQRRSATQRNKARKDLRQAELVLNILLEDWPADLDAAIEAALHMPAKFRKQLKTGAMRVKGGARLIAMLESE